MFKIECGECRKKQDEAAAQKPRWLRSPIRFYEQYSGDTLEDAYKKFIAHVAEKHPEMMGDAYRWESYILRERRPWYRHPRWHVWHWHIQIHPLQNFKRWAFSRCSKCGGRFKYGECPVSGSWDSDGPRWFRSETNTFHSECDDSRKPIPSNPNYPGQLSVP